MNVSCPHCGKQLKISDKFRANLQNLRADQKAKVKCTQCSQPFAIDRKMLATNGASSGAAKKPAVRATEVKPPGPPDVTWLKEGIFEGQEVVEDIPQALVLMPEGEERDSIVKAVEGLGYRAEIAESVDRAMEKMEFVNYASVIFHTDFEPGGLYKSRFHEFMSSMSMSKRRYIFYTLIGDELHTLYDLQALSYSANIVVNSAEAVHYGTILRKAIPDYETLFGPLMEELRVLGK